jgi:hypothetical protein
MIGYTLFLLLKSDLDVRASLSRRASPGKKRVCVGALPARTLTPPPPAPSGLAGGNCTGGCSNTFFLTTIGLQIIYSLTTTTYQGAAVSFPNCKFLDILISLGNSKNSSNQLFHGVINLSGTGVFQSKVLSHITCRIVLVLKVKGVNRPKRSYRGTHSHKIDILVQSPLENF